MKESTPVERGYGELLIGLLLVNDALNEGNIITAKEEVAHTIKRLQHVNPTPAWPA